MERQMVAEGGQERRICHCWSESKHLFLQGSYRGLSKTIEKLSCKQSALNILQSYLNSAPVPNFCQGRSRRLQSDTALLCMTT